MIFDKSCFLTINVTLVSKIIKWLKKPIYCHEKVQLVNVQSFYSLKNDQVHEPHLQREHNYSCAPEVTDMEAPISEVKGSTQPNMRVDLVSWLSGPYTVNNQHVT